MKKHNLLMMPLIMVVFLAFTSGCGKDDGGENNIDYESYTDPRDGETYKTVKIGDQVWMAENLRYLPEVVGPDSGSHAVPLYYVLVYEGNSVAEAKASAYYNTYGVLYNWAAAKIACPAGWHLPTDAEWMQLAGYVGGADMAGNKLKESGTEHWGVINDDITDEYGFTALPGGCCLTGGLFDGLQNFGAWWTNTGFDAAQATYILMTHNGAGVYKGLSIKEHGFSIRCVKD
ncbi:MAG: FISUMP domain-containing protein [Bacteroidota bacterium]